MERIERRHLVAGALAIVLCARSRPASAWVIPVEDVTRWWAMFEMLKGVKDITGQVSASLQHVQNAAAGLGGGNLVDDILLGYRRLTADISAVDYRIDTITRQFETVFPSKEAATHVAPSDVEGLREGWNREIHQSGLAAARAQAALSTVERNTASAQAILERSKASTGGANDEGSRLAKLQAVVQMLGVLNSDLANLATVIATTERVNASVAAAAASDEDLEAAKAERMMRDYTKTETIPDVDQRLLSW